MTRRLEQPQQPSTIQEIAVASLRESERPHEWALSVGFSAVTAAEQQLALDLQSGRRFGPYAITRDGSRYPLPGYVIVPKSESADGIRVEYPASPKIFA